MSELETQVGQIFISSKKLSKSFVSLFSEKISETNSEIYFILEVSSNTQSAWAEYDRIAKNIENILKRNFRKDNPNNFENSLAQVNDYLSKLASEGQVTWVGKLNACIAVRKNENLYISTCGKVHAYLFRDKQFSDIADSGEKPNPLKTFENFAIGKIKKKDYLILSTAQLFNYVSIERLQNILGNLPISVACQTIVDLVKELADGSVSFGTLVLEFGDSIELEGENIMKIAGMASGSKSLPDKLKMAANSAFGAITKFIEHTILLSKEKRIPNINLPKINTELIKEQARQYTDLKKIKDLPKAKKFFLIAGATFILLFIINIAVTVYVRNKTQKDKAINQKISDIQNKINDANTSFVFKDQSKAVDLTNQAKQELDTLPNDPKIADQHNKLSTEIQSLLNLVEHIQNANLTKLFTYNGTQADRLLKINNVLYAINSQGSLFIPYDLNSQTQSNNFTVPVPDIKNINSINGLFVFEDGQGNIYQTDPAKQSTNKQKGHLNGNDAGLNFYGSPTRVYTMDKSSNQIISTLLAGNTTSNYFKAPENLSNALDFSIDGSIYVLTTSGIQKFSTGKPQQFPNQNLTFSNGSKIYTDKNANFIYVLDPASKHIIVLDKQGSLVKQYQSDQFQNLKDFVVDEATQTMYILDGQNIWQMKM